MNLIISIIGRVWSLSFLLFIALLVYFESGGELPRIALLYLGYGFKLIKSVFSFMSNQWIWLFPTFTLIILFGLVKKFGLENIKQKLSTFFHNEVGNKSTVNIRNISLSKVIFSLSIVAMILSLISFNHVLKKDSICEFNLLQQSQYTCILSNNNEPNYRLVVISGGNKETIRQKVLLKISMESERYSYSEGKVSPKSASVGAGERYYQILNYGIHSLPSDADALINIEAVDNIQQFKTFIVKVVIDSNDFWVDFWVYTFLILLFLSVWFRKNTFMNGLARVIPYIVFISISITFVTWNM
ncbi:hypothetical protein [Thalassomonas sp. M1454]|uniref:hypothetical protein n=1 Tax=Thalassomonas sp. M1454 TaxID=2594477 RepID=UPI00117D187E|nr:hypothetical protein [Thalassomonas sp. M1454]TRX56996.1 hypothetical protein FNN08_05665 [Thalassomonas sp. M1454]